MGQIPHSIERISSITNIFDLSSVVLQFKPAVPVRVNTVLRLFFSLSYIHRVRKKGPLKCQNNFMNRV